MKDQLTYADLFTGGGFATRGAMNAGLNPIWGNEHIERIGKWGASQNGHPVIIDTLLNLDPRTMARPDFLHMSPPCPSFSVANTNKGETENDILLARKCAEFITIMKPKYFTLENVWGYRHSHSWGIINKALHKVYGIFSITIDHIDFADLGVPQSRKRMIVRAVKGGYLQPIKLIKKVNHVGWFSAVSDIMHTFQPSKLSEWQIKRLESNGWLEDLYNNILKKRDGWDVSLLSGENSGGNGFLPHPKNQTSYTVTTTGTQKALLLNATDKRATARHTPKQENQPAMTQRPTLTQQGFLFAPRPQTLTPIKNFRSIIEEAKVLRISPSGMARFMSVPDDYKLPKLKTLATHILGNGVPCLGYQRIVEGMINDL